MFREFTHYPSPEGAHPPTDIGRKEKDALIREFFEKRKRMDGLRLRSQRMKLEGNRAAMAKADKEIPQLERRLRELSTQGVIDWMDERDAEVR